MLKILIITAGIINIILYIPSLRIFRKTKQNKKDFKAHQYVDIYMWIVV